MPNNRELAILTWIAVAAGWVLTKQPLRASAVSVLRCLRTPKLAIPLALLCAYAIALVVGLWRRHVWEPRLMTATLFWFTGTALALFLAFDDAAEDPHFFRRRVGRAASFTVLVGFVAGLRSFGIVIELVAVPVLVVVGGMAALAEHKHEFRQLKGCLTWCIAVAGFITIAYSLSGLVQDPSAYVNLSTARALAVPIVLTLCLLPFVYALTVYGGLDGILTRLRLHLRDDPAVYRYARRRVVRATRLRLRGVRRVSRSPLRLMLPTPCTRADVDRFAAHLRSKRLHVLAMSPAAEAEVERIASNQDPGWEYLLFAARLDAGATAAAQVGGSIDSERRFEPAINKTKALRTMSEDRQAAVEHLGGFDELFDEHKVTVAFGSPGEPGDPSKIVALAEELLVHYDEMLQWRKRARGIRSDGLDELLAIHAQLLDRPIQQVEDYIDRWVDLATRLPDLLRDAGNVTDPIKIDMSLVLTADNDLIQQFTRLSARVAEAA